MTLLLALTLSWHAPICTQGSDLCAPASCVECAVVYVHRRTGPTWWREPVVRDTLAKIAATDGRAMGYLLPLWVDYGTTLVVCRDAARNWSRWSNLRESKRP